MARAQLLAGGCLAVTGYLLTASMLNSGDTPRHGPGTPAPPPPPPPAPATPTPHGDADYLPASPLTMFPLQYTELVEPLAGDTPQGGSTTAMPPNSCHSVKALLKGYAVESCFDSERCYGEVRIRALTGCAAGAQRKVSHSLLWDAWLKRHIGPDLIWLVLSGPEMVLAPQSFDAASCAYTLRFALRSAGEYTAKFRLQLTDHWGVNEVVHNTPHWKNKDIAWLPRYACAAPDLTPARGSPLGRWVSRRLSHAGYKANPKLRGNEWEWQPYRLSGSLPSPSPAEFAGCLRSLRRGGEVLGVRVVGDSQARSIYHAVRQRLLDMEIPYDAMRVKVANASTSLAPDMSLGYTLDSYLENLNLSDDNVLIIGFGAHPASWGQWTYSDMHVHMLKVAAALCKRQGATVWFGAPAWPKGKPANVAKFRVTNARLGIFNRIAQEALKPCDNVKHVDFFQLSLPQLKLSKDGAHYDKSVVMTTFVDLLSDALCETARA